MSILRQKGSRHEPQRLISMTFLAAIAIGGLLLCLPVSQASGKWGSPLPCFFLATSSVCVTGLSPYEIASTFTLFGKLVILALVELGGLGIMTLGSVFFEIMGHSMNKSQEQAVLVSLGESRAGRFQSTLASAVRFTLGWEIACAIVLGARFYFHYGYSVGKATLFGAFHAVAGFCNAGLSLFPDSMMGFRHDPVVLSAICAVVIMGGLGFIVHKNVTSLAPWRRDRMRRGRVTLHTRIVLVSTLALLLAGQAVLLVSEWDGALAGLSFWEKIYNSFFFSAITRTAGFNNVDMGIVSGPCRAFTMLVMFIGGASGSTAGGIKVTTAFVLAATVVAMIRNHGETEFAHRTIPARVVREAIVITILSLAAVFVAVLAVHFTEMNGVGTGSEGLSLVLTFEAVSALGTVGLSLGATPFLSTAGMICIMVCMFVGRLGPLTIAMAMAGAGKATEHRYPEENIVVG